MGWGQGCHAGKNPAAWHVTGHGLAACIVKAIALQLQLLQIWQGCLALYMLGAKLYHELILHVLWSNEC